MSRSEPRSPLDPELFPELAEWVDWSNEDGFTDYVEAIEPADAPSFEVVWRLGSNGDTSRLDKRPDPTLKPSEAGSLESLLKEREFLNWAQYADNDLRLFLVSPAQVSLDTQPLQELCEFHHDPSARRLWDELSLTATAHGARLLGKALAELHKAATRAEVNDHCLTSRLVHNPPWVLELALPTADLVARISPARNELLRWVQGPKLVLGRAILEAKQAWTRRPQNSNRLIHGRLERRNAFLMSGSQGIRISGWEHLQLGDPAWDVGATLANFAQQWLGHCAVGAQAPQPAPTQIASDLRRAAKGFAESYCRESGEELPAGTLRATAIHLFRKAWDWAAEAERLDARRRYQLQLADNLLRDRRAALRLFGLTTAPKSNAGRNS